MTRTALLALACLASVACAQQPTPPSGQAPALVELKVADVPAENGKTLNATFRELERAQTHSVVEVFVASGGSVSSSMFTLRGVCAVVRARSEKFGQSEPVAGQPGKYKVSFPTAPAPEQLRGPNKSVFSLEECALLRF
jgi:hypothetical protein